MIKCEVKNDYNVKKIKANIKTKKRNQSKKSK